MRGRITPRAKRRRNRSRQHGIKCRRPFGRLDRRHFNQRFSKCSQMPRQSLPFLTGVKPEAAWNIRSRGKRFRGREMERQQISGRARRAWRQGSEIAKR